MVDNRRNSSSGIIILFLMFVFFSLIHEEKERQITGTAAHSSVITYTNNSGIQAMIGPSISTPGTGFYWINPHHVKFACPDCMPGREIIFNHLIASYFNSILVKSSNPIIGIFFLQKVPEQGKDDDLPSII